MGAKAALRSFASVVPCLFRVALLFIAVAVFYFYFYFTTKSEARRGLFVAGSSASCLGKLSKERFSKGDMSRAWQSAAHDGRLFVPKHMEERLESMERKATVELKNNMVGINQPKDQGQDQEHVREQEQGQLWEGGEELEGKKKREEEGNAPSPSRCCTTPAADLSKGTWRNTDGGVRDSPATVEWPAYDDTIFGDLGR